MIAWWLNSWSTWITIYVVISLTMDWVMPYRRGDWTRFLWENSLPTPSRRATLRALRTTELWVWWSRLGHNRDPRMIVDGKPATIINNPYARPALKMGYRGKETDYLYLDKFDRTRVQDHYAGNVGGYTLDELNDLISLDELRES